MYYFKNTHTQTQTHTQTHTHTHPHTHTHTHTHTPTQTHTHTHTRTHTCFLLACPTSIHAYTNVHIYAVYCHTINSVLFSTYEHLLYPNRSTRIIMRLKTHQDDVMCCEYLEGADETSQSLHSTAGAAWTNQCIFMNISIHLHTLIHLASNEGQFKAV